MIATAALADTSRYGHPPLAEHGSTRPLRAMTPVRAERTEEQAHNPPIVHVVGFDPDIRNIVCALVNSVGVEAKTYTDVGTFVRGGRPRAPGCLLVYAGLSLSGGLEFLIHFQRPGAGPPIVVVADRPDVRMAVLAMKAGAVDFLEGPCRDQDLLEALGMAIRMDLERWHADAHRAELRTRFETLTPRERQVMALVTQGLLNKQAAGELGVSEVTVKVHRGSAMRKMGARTLAELVRMADGLAEPAGPLRTQCRASARSAAREDLRKN